MKLQKLGMKTHALLYHKFYEFLIIADAKFLLKANWV